MHQPGRYIPSDSPKIDAHAHVGAFGSWCGVSVGAEEMCEIMARLGVKRTIISHPDNRTTLEAQRRRPDQFAALAWLNPADGETAVHKLVELAEAKQIQGLKLHPLFNAFVADDECVFPLVEAAQKRDLPIFVHSGHPPFSLPWSIGQLAERFPAARFVMVHMGHGHGVYIQAAIETARRRENIWLENSGMPMPGKILEACRRVGSERLFWGSDAPFHRHEAEMLRTEVSGLAPSELEKVFYGNIKAFMGWRDI
ncbi:MAG: amidohydrolase family protein [Deltaproteobacteria bacterium]|jgi:predicted TIM-barrel fold metal-dependent hydrolase|nr:amidohydrolase family protein [Deltaproteobacteria bacterium]